MGASFSNDNGDSNAWKKYCESKIIGKSGSYEGGNSFVGGIESIDKYVNSHMSASKQSLIHDIASALASLGIKQVDPSGKSSKEIVDALKQYLPDPRPGKGNGKTWSEKEPNQVKACKAIADIINKKYGSVVVDLNDKPEVLCERVSEIVHSLFVGVSEETMVMKKDIQRILQNIRILENTLEQGYKIIVDKINHNKESSLGTETAVLQEVHKDIMVELNRQRALLENMLNLAVKATDGDISDLLKETTEFRNLVKSLKNTVPGDKKFSEKISYLLNGFRTAAAAAKLVDEALKNLGMSYQDYAKLDRSDLKNALSEKLEEIMKKTQVEAMEPYMKAYKILVDHEYMRDDIINELKSKKGQGEVSGGSVVGGLKLDKKVKKRQEVRKQLLKIFNQRLSGLFSMVLKAGQKVGEDINSGSLPLSDDLDKFVKALDEIPDIQRKYVYYSLSGFDNDIQAKQDREQFIGHVKYLNSVIEKILKDKDYSKSDAFKDMKKGFEEIIELSETFANKFAESFGVLKVGMEEGGDSNSLNDVSNMAKETVDALPDMINNASDSVAKIAESAKSAFGKLKGAFKKGSKEDVVCADDFGVDGGAEDILPEITKIAYMLERTKDLIKYAFRTSKIKDNLKRFSSEYKSYTEDYVKILADSIASSVDDILMEKNKYIRPGYDKKAATQAEQHALRYLYLELTKMPGYAPDQLENAPDLPQQQMEEGKEKFAKILEFISKEYDTKIEMYRVAEAVDLYMSAFADGISSHPEDLQNIMTMLGSTEIVSKWFTNKSGDYLCQVFDTFPATVLSNQAVYNNLNEEYNKFDNSHYYLRVASLCRLGNFAELSKDYSNVVSGADWNAWETANLKVKTGNIHAGTNRIGLPGNPFLSIPIYNSNVNNVHTVNNVIKNMEKSLSISLLKNIMSMFVNIGKRFGGKDLDKQTHMSSFQIYKALLNYLIYGSFVFGSTDLTTMPDTTTTPAKRTGKDGFSLRLMDDFNTGNIKTDPNGSYNGILLKTGALSTSTAYKVATPNLFEKMTSYVSMRSVDNAGKSQNQFNDIFRNDCDKLFIMVIKSIIAKVLTTIGVYNMFNKPINKHGLGYPSDLRMILGGASDPKIITEALELYIRMPLFVEFYREIFNFDETGNNFRMITLVPEFDGIFSGLINLIFDKARYVKNGEYSTSDIRIIIEECNKIYSKFSNRKNPINDAIQELVAEINRRYGVVKKEERTRYLKEKSERFNTKYENWRDQQLTDFELQGIDENDDFPRPAPSMSYQTVGGPGYNAKPTHKYKLDLDANIANVNALRVAIENVFKHAKGVLDSDKNKNLDNLKRISFTGLLRARTEELKNAKTDKEKFDIAHNAINSLGQFAMSTLEKNLVMFHEVVVYPLNNLYAIYKVLKEFTNIINDMDNCLLKLGAFPDHDTYSTSWLGRPGAPQLESGGSIDFGNADFDKAIKPFMNFIDVRGVLQAGPSPAHIAVQGGTQGLVLNADVTYGDIQQMIAAAGTADELEIAKKYARRFTVDQQKMFVKLFETLFAHSATFDKLVEIKIDVQKALGTGANAATQKIQPGDLCAISVYIDHSKLFQHITDTFADVKINLDKFRGLLPQNIIKKYEELNNKSTGVNESSLYWLEKNLIIEFIQGKVQNQGGIPVTIDELNTKIRRVLSYLTKDWDFTADINMRTHKLTNANGVYKLTDKGVVGTTAEPTGKHYQEYTRVLQSLIYFDPFKVHVNFSSNATNYVSLLKMIPDAADAGKIVPERPQNCLELLLFNNSNITKSGVANGARWPDVPESRYSLYNVPSLVDATVTPNKVTWDNSLLQADQHRSVLIQFNRLVAAYLQQIYDSTTKKVYATCINSFANGSFSSAIMSNKNFNDFDIFQTNNILNDGKYQGVLFKTLAIMFRQMLIEMNDKNTKKQYYETDLKEIPMYVKERLKANLPIFNKLFTILTKRCELLKHMVRAFNVEQLLSLDNFVTRTTGSRRTGVTVSDSPVSREENEKILIAVLDQIIQGCNSLNQCIKDTLSEIADNGKYFETYNNFIATYENENGEYPFMPVSSITYALKNMRLDQVMESDESVKQPLMPIYELGENAFKFNYGIRKLINSSSTVKLDELPGMKHIMKQHNSSCDTIHQVDEKSLDKIINNNVMITRFLIDLRHYVSMFNTFNTGSELVPYATLEASRANCVTSHAFINFVDAVNSTAGINYKNSCYQLLSVKDKMNTQLVDVISLTESAFQKEQKSKLIDTVENVEGCPNRMDRKAMIAFNIIDLNIVPINLHALMREIPLINLIQYSYTFDHLMSELFGLKTSELVTPGATFNYSSFTQAKEPVKKLLGVMLVNPYVELDERTYNTYLDSLFRGSTGIQGFGRPKYLGDEIYNKVLFKELYPGTVYTEEGGPGYGDAHLRGKKEVLGDLSAALTDNKDYKESVINLVSSLIYSNVTPAQANAADLAAFTALVKPMLLDEKDLLPASRTNLVNPGNPGLNSSALYLAKFLYKLLMDPEFLQVVQSYHNATFAAQGIRETSERTKIPEDFIAMLLSIVHNGFDISTTRIMALKSTGGVELKDINMVNKDNVKKSIASILNSLNRGNYKLITATADLDIFREFKFSAKNVGSSFMTSLKTLGFDSLNLTDIKSIQKRNTVYFGNSLCYLEPDQQGSKIKEVKLDKDVISKSTLISIGKLRFDTTFLRNIIWFANIQRALRLKLRRDLSKYDTRIVKDMAITSPSVTELFDNNVNSENFDDDLSY